MKILGWASVLVLVSCGGAPTGEEATGDDLGGRAPARRAVSGLGAEPEATEAVGVAPTLVEAPAAPREEATEVLAAPACSGETPTAWTYDVTGGEACASFGGVAKCVPCVLKPRPGSTSPTCNPLTQICADTNTQCAVSINGWTAAYIITTKTVTIDRSGAPGYCNPTCSPSHWEAACAL